MGTRAAIPFADLRRRFALLGELLPNGGSLPCERWQSRHHGLVLLLWAHVALVPLFALLTSFSVWHGLADAAPIAVFAAAASVGRIRSHRIAAALVAAGLMTSSAAIVHLSGGAIEAHFHFFVIISLLLLYEDWGPFLLALAYVLLHHGVAGALIPETVYNHAAAQAHPWRWAAIHAAFVAAASAANIVNWRLNETVRREARRPAEERLARVEQQLLQSQKMEAVGQLAGGIAHDFNNLLTAISGYGELLQSRLTKDDESREMMDQILAASGRASSLTQQLLAFSRRQLLQPKVLDLNTIVRETEVMLGRLIGEDIEVDASLDPNLGSVRADPAQVQQVLLNLAVNARDAMPRGGRLTISTANVEVTTADAIDLDGAAPGEYVELKVADSGVGMDAIARAHAFEPFFTTKEPGRGTGLGLSTVYGIVRQSEGAIRVESEPDSGATFTILFPRVRTAPEVIAAEAPASARGGAERVLLVEDEHVVRGLLRETLEAQGYQVFDADTPATALELASRGEFDLLLTDVVMPRMNGRELAERILQSSPQVRVLYISGYTREAINNRAGLEPGTAFLQKPFTMAALGAKVREVLDAEPARLPLAS